MDNIHVSEASKLDAAIKEMYERLAQFLLRRLDVGHSSTVLEVGCGSGQLTIPFARRVRGKCVLIAYDCWLGPYSGGLNDLRDAIAGEGLEDSIGVVEGDVKQIGISDERVDSVISNELFCDLDANALKRALNEFYRILKDGGNMIHGELNPIPENKAQELLIKADLNYSIEALPFEGERWFSPTVEELSSMIRKAGFRNIQVSYFKTNLSFGYEAAVELLKRWKIDMAFVERYEKELKKHGLEFPCEHLIKCEKP